MRGHGSEDGLMRHLQKRLLAGKIFQKASIDIYSLLGKMTKPSREKNPPNTQGRLF